jgi:hypothetical protein
MTLTLVLFALLYLAQTATHPGTVAPTIAMAHWPRGNHPKICTSSAA